MEAGEAAAATSEEKGSICGQRRREEDKGRRVDLISPEEEKRLDRIESGLLRLRVRRGAEIPSDLGMQRVALQGLPKANGEPQEAHEAPEGTRAREQQGQEEQELVEVNWQELGQRIQEDAAELGLVKRK